MHDTHTSVTCKLRFANGASHEAVWSTPLGLHRATTKARKWTLEDAAEAKVKGRSKVVAIEIVAFTRKGAFTKD